ncbi:uncharacterized protein H6S33_002207 [Morchella sextelata]|uniref:uncharacterized protein n=1 Tax=Morchella sextelata TaxID=1174677 RepID=UPI001D0538ED|nr:uncharacterized protein H6S33_002207 [Morchella sextelata]KAH0608155.1 hypothetical protein H6S33_002207 [Morchella sextelata]
MLSLASLNRATPSRAIKTFLFLRRPLMTHPQPAAAAAAAAMTPTNPTNPTIPTTTTPRTRTPSPTTPPAPKRRRLHSTSPTPSTMSTTTTTTTITTTTITTTTPRIELSDTEETVRRLLVDAGAEIDTYNRTTGARNKEPVVLRFTGGWVRDKLLGVPSHDIDVGISRMTGYNFGLYLVDFLQRHYHSYGIEPGAVHKIESNPEKSKHLETATMKILGLDIDLVNLRSEVYKGDSRVPIMEFGTPVQDALRRDCTVNALFYNLHSRRVEDYTEHGLEDMRNKIIRTPLPPQETFDDDPLRILRLVRFSSRLGFEIVPEAREAMKLPEIIDALRHKISRERIGVELHKMFTGPSPHRALTLLYEHSLYPAIFCPPTIPFPDSLPLHTLPRALAATRHLTTLTTPLLPTAHGHYLTWLLTAVTPWNGVVLEADMKRRTPAAASAVREGLKVVNKVHDVVARAFQSVDAVRGVLAEGEWGRARLGVFVKELGAAWRSCVLLSEVLELVEVWEGEEERPSKEAQAIIDKYEHLAARIIELGMEEAYLIKPLVDGNELLTIFSRPRGAWIAKAMPKILEWQWDNPAAGKEEALEWVKAQKAFLLRA